jgi:hypothetical protein
MRGPRSALSAGLTVLGLHLLMIVSVFGAATSPAAAADGCSCLYQKAGVCVLTDPACKSANEWYEDPYTKSWNEAPKLDWYKQDGKDAADYSPSAADDCLCLHDQAGSCMVLYSQCKYGKIWYDDHYTKSWNETAKTGWFEHGGKGATDYLTGKGIGTTLEHSLPGYPPYWKYDANKGYSTDYGGYASPGSTPRVGPTSRIPGTAVGPSPYDGAFPPGPVVPAGPGSQKSASKGARPKITNTGYSHLVEAGTEVDGYGLYSYAILPSDSERAALFLNEVFKEFLSIGTFTQTRASLNILYVPLRKDKQAEFTAMLRAAGSAATLGAEYTKSFYDYGMAQALLNRVCNPPDPSVQAACSGSLSKGPYLFTYVAPASKIEPLPPPFLFVDLSRVEPKGFAELLDAFRAQVKQDDISDQARIETLRLKVLEFVLRGSSVVGPVHEAVAKIIHAAFGSGDKK